MASLPDKRKAVLAAAPVLPSSSPAFGTPLPLLPAHKTAAISRHIFKQPAVLPIILPATTLRPLAFRTFTKKYNLTLSTSALATLATFIGKHCGARWKDDGLAEGVLEEVAKLWKKQSTEPIVKGEEENFRIILKTVEGSMTGGKVVSSKKLLSRQTSFAYDETGNSNPPTLNREGSLGLSALNVRSATPDLDEDDEAEITKNPREWLKVIDAYHQPCIVYNTSKKNFEKLKSKPSILPPPTHKTDYFRQRYYIVHQRLLQNEGLDQHHLISAMGSGSSSGKLTQIANLLGRHNSPHSLLGMLIVLPTGVLALSDLTGAIALDLAHARPYPDSDSAAWYCPGMMLVADGVYVEDGKDESALGSMGGIGATISGKFALTSLTHPPPEPRSQSLGIQDLASSSHFSGPVFGWTDFLGVGAERATGSRMRRLQSRILGSPLSSHPTDQPVVSAHRNRKFVLASQVLLDQPRSISAIHTLFSHYASKPPSHTPLAIILIGPFTAQPAMSGSGAFTTSGHSGAGSNVAAGGTSGLAYKEAFNNLANVLSDFPTILAHTTLILVPSDGDAWSSAHGAGSAVPLPRKGVPNMFTTRVDRVVAEVNREVHGRKTKSTATTVNGKISFGQNPVPAPTTAAVSEKEGEVVWASNPTRLTWFGSLGEMAILSDDITGRLRRSAVRFNPADADEDDLPADEMQIDEALIAIAAADDVDAAAKAISTDLAAAQRLTKTIIDQAHLSPFPLSSRPVHWDYGFALSLFPLPTALVLADNEMQCFAVNYAGCCVMNPGPLASAGGSCWMEYDLLANRGAIVRGK